MLRSAQASERSRATKETYFKGPQNPQKGKAP